MPCGCFECWKRTVYLQKDTHGLWVKAKCSQRFKSDDALACHLLSFITVAPLPAAPRADLMMEECSYHVLCCVRMWAHSAKNAWLLKQFALISAISHPAVLIYVGACMLEWHYVLHYVFGYVRKQWCNTFTSQIKGPEHDTLLHEALLSYNFPMECDTTSLSVLQLLECDTSHLNVGFLLECCGSTLVCCYHNRLSLLSKGL